jgi:hypothetical protein
VNNAMGMKEGDGEDEIADEMSCNLKREFPSLHRFQNCEAITTLGTRMS